MQDDARDVAVRAFLREMAVEVPPPSIPTATLLRRARWGMGARIGGLAVALLLAASGVAAGVAALRASSEVPANEGLGPVDLRVTARIEVDGTPQSVVVGDGSVWVSQGRRSISRIDPASRAVLDSIEVIGATGSAPEIGDGTSPGCVAAGFVCGGGGSSDALWELAFAEGAVWATTSDGGGRVLRVDASTDEIGTTIDVPGAYGIAAGEGAVWVTGSSQGTGTLVRIDPGANRAADPLFLDAQVNALAVGGGSVWVALSGGPVLRIDPVSLGLQETYDPDVDGINDLAFGGGALWGAGDGVVVRLDPGTGAVVETTVSNPEDIAFGDGVIWVSAYDSNEVLALDPSSGAIIGRLVVGDSPNGKAFFAGTLWVALDLENAVLGLQAGNG